MLDKIYQESIDKMIQSINHTQSELNKVRTGRANPEIFNSIVIDYYGINTPLNQAATITVPESRLITIQPYEKSLIPNIEKAINDANMGYNPSNNGSSILIPVPPLSEERRGELIKFVHKLIEDGKVSIRNIRRDSIQSIQSYGKEESISEDEIKGRESDIQKLTDNNIDLIINMEKNKEIELKEI